MFLADRGKPWPKWLFLIYFFSNVVFYGPYWKNIEDYWQRRNQDNILFLFYEDMKADLKSVIRQTAKFLGKTLNDDEVLKLEDHLSFESMKTNKSVNNEDEGREMAELFKNGSENIRFIRQGKVGGYKTDMSPQLIRQFDEWTEVNSTKLGIQFKC